jgi:hypothetical protein
MKSYLRYEPKDQFGVITSPQCNVQYDYTGNLAFTGAIQDVCAWNLRQASQVSRAFILVKRPPKVSWASSVLGQQDVI